MKKYFILLATLFCSQAFAISGRTLWGGSNEFSKAAILETYTNFLQTYEGSSAKRISLYEQIAMPDIFSSAWADDVLNCIYAGWPSLLVNGKCSSPIKNNPDYNNGSCGANSMQCQPLLFGANLCAPIVSNIDRQMAFSNCNKQFKESGISYEGLVKEIQKNKDEKKLLNLLDLADQICKTGVQKSSGMCKLLMQNLEAIKKMNISLSEVGAKEVVLALSDAQKLALTLGKNPKTDCVVVKPQTDIAPPVLTGGKIVVKPQTDTAPPVLTGNKIKLNNVVDSSAEALDRKPAELGVAPANLPSFERLVARIPMVCGGARTNNDGIDVTYDLDCTTNAQYPSGYAIGNNPGHPYLDGAKSLYPDGGPPTRRIEFVSRDHASKETYLYLTDIAGGEDSHDVKSVMVLLPRLGVPTTEVVGNDVVVTMTTGEKVVFDKNTHGIKSGALKEGPIDLTTDRFKRQPPNVQYTGAGISIRVNHRYEYPTMGADMAEIRQNGRVCKIARGKIWNKDGKLLTDEDVSLVDVVNKNCPAKGSEVAFHL